MRETPPSYSDRAPPPRTTTVPTPPPPHQLLVRVLRNDSAPEDGLNDMQSRVNSCGATVQALIASYRIIIPSRKVAQSGPLISSIGLCR